MNALLCVTLACRIAFFDIPPGDVGPAINEWSYAAAVQVLYDYSEPAGIDTRGLRATRSAAAALTALLDATGFTFEWVNERTVVVVPIPRCAPELGAEAPVPPCHDPRAVRL